MFVDSLLKYNSGDFETTCNESYSYESFIDDMYQLGRTLQESVNEFCRVVNESAVESIHEGSDLVPTASEATKNTLMDKLKKIWHAIVEKTMKVIDNIYDFIYEQLVLHKNFIKKHEEAIMKNELIYEKPVSGEVPYNKKVGKYTINDTIKIKDLARVNVDSIKSYKDILSPNFINIYLDENTLKDFETDSGRIDKEKLNKKYKEEILGSENKDHLIDIDDINKHKKELISNIDNIYNHVKSNRNKIRILNNQRKNPPKDLTPEQVDEFKKNMMNQVDSIKEYNKVLLEYCKVDSSILKMYINAEITDSLKEGK